MLIFFKLNGFEKIEVNDMGILKILRLCEDRENSENKISLLHHFVYLGKFSSSTLLSGLLLKSLFLSMLKFYSTFMSIMHKIEFCNTYLYSLILPAIKLYTILTWITIHIEKTNLLKNFCW